MQLNLFFSNHCRLTTPYLQFGKMSATDTVFKAWKNMQSPLLFSILSSSFTYYTYILYSVILCTYVYVSYVEYYIFIVSYEVVKLLITDCTPKIIFSRIDRLFFNVSEIDMDNRFFWKKILVDTFMTK